MKATALFKNGLWISYATFVTRIFAFLSSLVLARLLQPSDFGIIGIAYVFWSFFSLFIQDTAGAFIIYKGIEHPKYVNTAYTISLLVGIALAVGVAATAPFVAMFFKEPTLTWILVAFAFNLILSSASYVYSSVMTRQLKYRAIANITLVNSITRLVSTTAAAFLGFSYWSFVIGDTASWIVNCVLTRYYSKYKFRLQIDPEVKSEVKSFYFGTVASSFGLYTNFNIDNFTVGKLLGSTSLGYYNLAYQLTNAFSSIVGAIFNQLGMPVFAQLSHDQQQKTLLKVVEQTAILTVAICASIFLVVDSQVVTLVFGAKWIPIVNVIPGLLIFSYFRIINSSLFSMLVAKGRPDINAKVNLQIAPIAVISFILGANLGGIVGVSLAVALVLGVGWTVYWWWVACRSLGWSFKQFIVPCFIPILLIIPGLLISFSLPLLIRPFTLILTYLISIRIFMPQMFGKYKIKVNQLLKRVQNLRHNN
ncbi:oligosaccharide flippase family protein [Rivularia sp. UHCC 0363]|uniref:oligosaccharide flippase family protein n=1 Tax=Rivularia sp. UHCC 0363 TaxID=3110244 RepID=UPI002B21E181|nr:oligosaccharide flippase family protein [Rivularia sp. UHCC 0363]MEA5592810.1 oligosaccharide flippase family protein [Rivularia sp. UHCC 0363]